MKTRAVFYARVSTKLEEQQNAIELQIEENRKVIQSKGWELVDEYIDRGITGTIAKKRDEYTRLMGDMSSGKFDIIVVKDQERSQRNTRDWYLFVDCLVQNDIRLFFYMDNKFYTPDDALITGVKAIIAEDYSRNLSKKMKNYKRTRRELILSGDYSKIPAPKVYGYKAGHHNGSIEIEEAEAEVVRKIYDLYVSGSGVRAIAKALEAEGVLYRGKPLGEGTINSIINNSRYKGTYEEYPYEHDFEKKKRVRVEGEIFRVDNCIPKIVPVEVWDKAQELKEARKRAYSNDEGQATRGANLGHYTFSSKIVCGKCGATYWRAQRIRSGKLREKYICSTKRAKGMKTCDCRNVYEEDLLAVCAEVAEQFTVNREAVKADMEKWLEDLIKRLSNQGNLKALTEKQTALQKRLDILLDNLLDGTITKEMYTRKAGEINTELERISQELTVAKKSSSDLKDAERALSNIDKELDQMIGGTDSAKDMMKADNYKYLIEHIDKITVFEDRLEVTLDITKTKFVKVLPVSSCERSMGYHNGFQGDHHQPVRTQNHR